MLRQYGWRTIFPRICASPRRGRHRGAAARFGVMSSAIRWVDVWRRTGRTAPYPRGGDLGTDRGRGRVLAGQGGGDAGHHTRRAAGAAKERDLSVGTTVWRFFDRHGISFKKNRARADDVPRAGWPGSKANPISIPADWCSSMRPAPRPRWPVCGAARSVANAAVPRSHMDIGRQLPSPPVYAGMA